jgi:hypothetical protein
MSDACDSCETGLYPPPDKWDTLCDRCRGDAFRTYVVSLAEEMERGNCYQGDGVLCTCSHSEKLYRELLSVCGVGIAPKEDR